MFKLGVTLLLLLFSLSGAAQPELAPLEKITAAVIRAHFSQQRQLSGINQVLHSSGRVIISKESGIYWQQQQPFNMTVLLTPLQLSQQVEQQPWQVIRAEENPQLFQFTQLLQALFSGQTQVIQQQFSVRVLSAEPQWRLALVPLQAPFNQVFAEIELSGETLLQQVILRDRQGDTTQIDFTQQQLQPDVLSGDEQLLFKPR